MWEILTMATSCQPNPRCAPPGAHSRKDHISPAVLPSCCVLLCNSHLCTTCATSKHSPVHQHSSHTKGLNVTPAEHFPSLLQIPLPGSFPKPASWPSKASYDNQRCKNFFLTIFQHIRPWWLGEGGLPQAGLQHVQCFWSSSVGNLMSTLLCRGLELPLLQTLSSCSHCDSWRMRSYSQTGKSEPGQSGKRRIWGKLGLGGRLTSKEETKGRVQARGRKKSWAAPCRRKGSSARCWYRGVPGWGERTIFSPTWPDLLKPAPTSALHRFCTQPSVPDFLPCYTVGMAEIILMIDAKGWFTPTSPSPREIPKPNSWSGFVFWSPTRNLEWLVKTMMTLRGKEVLKGFSGSTSQRFQQSWYCMHVHEHLDVGHREQLFTSVLIKLSEGKEENFLKNYFLKNNLVLRERKKHVFLVKHQRKGNKNPVIFNLNSLWVEKSQVTKKAPTNKDHWGCCVIWMDTCKHKDWAVSSPGWPDLP